MQATRLFYVTDSMPSNEELFTTREQAEAHYNKMLEAGEEMPRLRICEVKNAYSDWYASTGDFWNYDDQADTFTTITTLKEL